MVIPAKTKVCEFFFRIVQALLDESDEIQHLTMLYIRQWLLKRKPKIIYHHFIESLFHYKIKGT